ncbi:MAG TPA: riboflavin synthase [Planctomycetaceae bacterium]|jgi:riboflavin synthase|nr:riboflavin synthase [Planctomycetaceae bacterium]
MFTGLVAGRGFVHDVRPEGVDNSTAPHAAPTLRLAIQVPDDFGPPGTLGESVSVNGCCLTAIAIEANRWSFQAGSETLSKTNLGRLSPGEAVNLERALPVDGRLGGHFVQGHVDGVGQVDRIERQGEWVTMWFRVSPTLVRQMVPKGSVAVDGVSLTIVQIAADCFSVALIPHTLEVTTLGLRKSGDAVNIETDILGKYVQQLLKT